MNDPHRPVIHFWSPSITQAELADWRPDEQPQRYPDGRGHALFELYARCRDAGEPVTIGPRPAADTGVVVVFSKDLSARHSWSFLLRAAHLPCVLIASDWPPSFRIPIRPDITVRSTSAACRAEGEVMLPLLPQRGLVRRAAHRIVTVTTIGYKGDPRQAPAFLRSDHFHAALAPLGVWFEADDLDGSPARWPDFERTDVALCMRAEGHRLDHKPPTKLINAWVAGCIPLIGPEPAYEELAAPGSDSLHVTDEQDVIDAIRRMCESPALVSTLEAGVAGRGAEFAAERVLERWLEVLDRAAALDRRGRAGAIAAGLRTWVGAEVHKRRRNVASS